MKHKKGFTLIELLVVVAIMGLLAALAIVALGQARLRARDARRVADIKQVQTALELYYLDNNQYPADGVGTYLFRITVGSDPTELGDQCISATGGLSADCLGTTYMGEVPTNPNPRNDGSCADSGYKYNLNASSTISYEIEYCLGSATGDLAAGWHCATPAGMSHSGAGC